MPKRRQFTAEYKRALVGRGRGLPSEGAIGALLRREGLYSSHLIDLAPPARAGRTRQALAPKKRGRKPTANPLAEENRGYVRTMRA